MGLESDFTESESLIRFARVQLVQIRRTTIKQYPGIDICIQNSEY